MPNYVLRVGTSDGQVADREIRADDLSAAKEEASRQGLHVFNVRSQRLDLKSILPNRKAITIDRFLLFNQELLALVKAGLPIVQSLDIMLERQKNLRFKEILAEIKEKIKSGIALSDAFASYGSMFPPIYSTSLRAGERSGDLEGVLKRFLRYQKLISALRRKVLGALIYPTVIVCVSLVMVFIMLTVVIPKFSEFYQGFGAALPPFTAALINLSFILRTNAPLIIAAVAVLVFLLRRWTRSNKGGVRFDSIKLRIPLIGSVLRKFAILQFTQSLETLLGGGTPMVPAIEIASQSVTNKLISSRVFDIVQKVREGEPLWRSLESTEVMSDLAVEMIKVGESTGALTEMLSNVSEFYDEEIEATLSRMVALIEPIILIGIGIVVAVLLYAFYLPLFKLTSVQQ